MDLGEAMEFVGDALCEERAVDGVDADPAVPNRLHVRLVGGTVLVLTVEIEADE